MRLLQCLDANVCVVPEMSVVMQESEECVKDFWIILVVRRVLSVILFLGGEADDNDSFVDIMSSITALGDAEWEGWTFADALAGADLSAVTLAEGVVDISRLPTR